MGIQIDVNRMFLDEDPAYVVLIRAIVQKADDIGDKLDKARAVKIANAIRK